MEYIVTFLEGIASFISPCVLPMLPVYISYFTGQKYNKKHKAFINSIGFVIGFSIIFVLLGILASSIGSYILRYQNIIKIIFGIVIVIFGLNMMETIKIPFLNKTFRPNMKKKEFNFISSMLFGILFSIGWTPCVGAFLGSALMMASTEGQILKGSILLICYSVGLGIPFILSSILIEKLKNVFSWVKEHYKLINTISGLFLIIIGCVMIGQTIFNKVETKEESLTNENIVNENILVEEQEEEGGKIMNITSSNFEKEVLQSDIPVLVDFWASWCGPCKLEMPDFDEAYGKYGEDIHFLMVNMTDGYQENVESAKEFIDDSGYNFPVYYDTDVDAARTYGVYSIPTTYFIDKDGYVIANGRGALDAETLQIGIDYIYDGGQQ